MDLNKYFDKVICLDCLDEENHDLRADNIKNEINRLGITDTVSFAHMQRLPYIKNIVKGFAKDEKIISFDYNDESCFRSFDYAINFVRILKHLIADHIHNVLFFEDDVVFLKDINIIESILSSAPENIMISLYDGYVSEDQKQYFRLTPINEYWSDYLLMWNTDCFSLNYNGMKYIVSAMEEKLAYTDYYTWAVPGSALKLIKKDIFIPSWNTSVSHAISNIPLAIQKNSLQEKSMHGNKNVKNLIKYDLSMFNI